ncbi:MAG TPA: biotin--[acetyl-CoA-carboxylase] ligase, partial [Acidimicrobiia bacterium]|nr:biotin--[acetyl-CoA-carboxylase] ligase [Acidimicrobiia bacterium]
MTAGPPILEFDRDRLTGTRFTTVRTYAQLDSTNSALVEEARSGAPEGLVLVADHQTGGRGRLGRTWSAAPGAALLVSVLLRPPLAPDDAFLAAHATGVAAVDACRQV